MRWTNHNQTNKPPPSSRAKKALRPLVATLASLLTVAASSQYPPPLLHTPTNHPAAHVLILSLDGVRAIDLERFITANPDSALAGLAARGVDYTNAHVPWPDPAAGLVSLVTGGTPISTGILSIDGYDRSLSPPGSNCQRTGTPIPLAAVARTAVVDSAALDSARLPRDPARGCAPVPPSALLHVNNLFEVVRAHGGRTAWAGKNPQLVDLLEGPTGHGLDELCGLSPATTTNADLDNQRLTGVLLHWIDGRDCSGTTRRPVPELFGVSFAESQDQSPGASESRLASTDRAIARIVSALQRSHLYDSTWIVVTSPYGRAASATQKASPAAALVAVADAVRPGLIRHIAVGKVALLWLSDPEQSETLARALVGHAAALGIDKVQTSDSIGLIFNAPAQDSRMPDLILTPLPRLRWIPANHKGVQLPAGPGEDSDHVPLLISGSQLTPRRDKTLVPTSQTAPLLLRALGMEKFDLDALHREHTPALPGIF